MLAEAGIPTETVERLLGYWGVRPQGNFEGRSILQVAVGALATPPPKLQDERAGRCSSAVTRGFARARRQAPVLVERPDDFRLRRGGRRSGRSDYLDAACGCARFVLDSLRGPDGHLLRSWKDGDARLNAYLEDHAFSSRRF